MVDQMKCPNCSNTMEKATIGKEMKSWIEWTQQKSSPILGGPLVPTDMMPFKKNIEVYVCKNCGYVERYAK